ncbi:Amino-transferase class IV [Plasmodiophora brassicae]|uniref:Uncharacterized protein n=1 Tax=Plasmodiophora brassicae TaxID=37360 RepID=A0A0G4IRM9_PLABS|nr:hypothetical protein PBRA_006039 [Plasmodiophora brassicae]SPQ98141.1 unnamed protein product [Plasmodiophora brassicae]
MGDGGGDGMFVVYRGGVVSAVAESRHAFLLAAPRGAYTVMRTTQNRQRLLCFEHHLQRLSTSAMAIGADRTRVEPGRLERDVLHAIRSAMSAGGDGDDELNVAVVVDMSGEVAVHLSILKERETGACVVVEAMRGSRAKYGSTKDSKWVVERQGLLDRRTAPEADDVVLVNDEGAVLEGLSSNFFVIGADQVVQTAPVRDGVLAGSIREIVMHVCRQHDIGIVERSPSWSSRSSWFGAFLTSTSRLVLPIHQVIDSVSKDSHGLPPLAFPAVHRIIDEISRLVSDAAHSDEFSRLIFNNGTCLTQPTKSSS